MAVNQIISDGGGSNVRPPVSGGLIGGSTTPGYRQPVVSMPKLPPVLNPPQNQFNPGNPTQNNTTATGGGSSGGGGGGGAIAGGGGMTDYYGQMQQNATDLYNKQVAALEAAKQQREAARMAGYDAITGARQAGYDRGAEQANYTADEALRQAYIQSMMGQRNIGQQLSAMGRSGGAAESTLLGLQNQYGQTRGQLERGRADNLSALDLALMEGKAADRKALEDARANDTTWDVENRLNVEQNYNQQIAAAQQAAAEAQANALMKQASAYKSSSGAASAADADSAKRVTSAINNAAKQGLQEDGRVNSNVYKNYLQSMYNTGQLNEMELANALSQSAGMFGTPGPAAGGVLSNAAQTAFNSLYR